MSFLHRNTSSKYTVVTLTALNDNYMYLLIDPATKIAAVVDPVEPEKVVAACKAHGVTLKVVLTTHSHWDHAGGNIKLAEMVPGLIIIGGKGDGADGVTREVDQGDTVEVGRLVVDVISTPCHTPGHVCFFVDPDGVAAAAGSSGAAAATPGLSPPPPSPAVFTGDTLFISGCGNFNDGTPQQMATAFERLAALPAATLVYCGHEYTASNLRYAVSFEPENAVMRAKQLWVAERREASPPAPTVPSTIGEEAEANPFMRVAGAAVPEVFARTGCANAADAIRWVRKDKDDFGRRSKKKKAPEPKY